MCTWSAACLLLALSSPGALAQADKVSLEPREKWTNLVAGSKMDFHFTVKVPVAFKGKAVWTFADAGTKNVFPRGRGEAPITADPKPTSNLISLGAAPDVVPPRSTVNHDYAVFSDKFAGSYSYPGQGQLRAAGSYGRHFAHMSAYWNGQLSQLVQIRQLPDRQLIDAYKTGFIYTQITRAGPVRCITASPPCQTTCCAPPSEVASNSCPHPRSAILAAADAHVPVPEEVVGPTPRS